MTLGPLHRRVQVEPLDDERVTNIERRLVVAVSSQPAAAPPARSRLAWATGALAAATVALAMWTWHQHAAAPIATPSVAASSVGAPQRTQVATDAGRATITVDDATIASDAGTAFAIARSGGDGAAGERVVVELAHGRLDLAVKHEPGRTLIIRAGDTDIEDVGTAFTVAYDGAAVDVRVTEGEVKVTRDRVVARVAAGDAWTSARGLVALAELPPLAPSSLFAPLSPLPVAAAKAPIVALAPRVAQVPVVPAAQPVSSQSAPHPAHVATASHAAAEPALARTPTAPLDPYVELRTAIRAQPIAFDPKIDGKADAANEIARLKLLAYSPTTVGGEASAALYRIAVLLHRPLEQDAAALNTLELYFRRFAGGKERTAALWLRVRIACGHKIDEGCRSAAYAYQRAVQTGDAADVAVRITDAQ